MKPIELNDPAEIEEFLSKISFTGKGFTTDAYCFRFTKQAWTTRIS